MATLTKLFPLLKNIGLNDQKSQEFIEILEDSYLSGIEDATKDLVTNKTFLTETAILRNDMAKMREDMAKQREEIAKQCEEMAKIRVEMANMKVELIKWNVGTIIAVAGLVTAIVKLIG